MQRPKKNQVLNYLECSQCRRDRRKCVPVGRIWPNRCNRCKRYNYVCSENQPKEAEKRTHSQNDDNPSPAKRLKHKTMEEHLEDLGYLGRLSRRLQDLEETKDIDGVAFYQQLPNDFVGNVNLALNTAIADGQAQVGSLITAKKHSDALILHERISNVRRPFPFLDHYSISDYETLVQLSESVGDYAAAEEYQEYMLLHDQASKYYHSEPAGVERTLLRLFDVSDQKLSTVATRWKIDPSLALSVTLSPYRLIQSNIATLFLDQVKKIAQSSRRDILKQSLLNLAARHGCIHVYQLLLLPSSVVDDITLNELNILLNIAAGNGHTAIVDKILANEVYTGGAGQYNLGTALLRASGDGNVKTAKLLLEKGADIRAVQYGGMTALYSAASHGQEAMVKLLLEKGADIDAVDDGGCTALHSAAVDGHEAMVKLLLEKGADIEAADDGGSTALGTAVACGHEAMVKLLLEKGADIEAVDYDGQTILHSAASHGQEAMVKLLLEKGLRSKQ